MMGKHKRKNQEKPQASQIQPATSKETDPDWDNECEVCGMTPIVPLTGLCGPCTFGEADTIYGNW